MPEYNVSEVFLLAEANRQFGRIPEIDDERYGEPERIGAYADYGKISVQYKPGTVDYLSSAWAGRNLIIKKALRIFNQDKEDVHVREVLESDELESIAAAYAEKTLKILGKLK